MVSLLKKDPQKVFSFLKSEFQKLEIEEQDVLIPFIKRYYNNLYNKNNLSLTSQMHLLEILNALEDDKEGTRILANLKLNEISDLQLTSSR